MEDVSCEEVDHPLGDPLTHHIHQTLQNIFKNPDHSACNIALFYQKHIKCFIYNLTENISFCQKLCGIRNLPSPCSDSCFSYGWHIAISNIGYWMMMMIAISDMDDIPSFGSHWRHYTVSQQRESKLKVLLTSSSFRTSLGLEYQYYPPQDLWSLPDGNWNEFAVD